MSSQSGAAVAEQAKPGPQASVDRSRPEAGGSRAGRPAYERFLEALEDLLRDRDRRRADDRRLLDRSAHDRRSTPQAQAQQPAPERLRRYVATTAGLTALLMAGLALANFHLAPMTYSARRHAEVAAAFAAGDNYGVFDLNVDTRGLRRAHLARMQARPEVIVYGASHWQEAHAELLPDHNFYNAHVHRDYHEDILGLVEMLIRYDRLPETLLISIRDLTFASIASRSDYLWLTGTYDYRSMAARLDVEPAGQLEMLPERHYLGLFSLATLLDNAVRWWTAPVQPGPVRAAALPTLDVLQADGSIRWSAQHRAAFTAERRHRQVEAAFKARQAVRPEIDPAAVDAVDRLLGLLTERGVRVVLIHPPFNPEFYDRIAGTRYDLGLREVEALTRRLANTHGAIAVGSFDPAAAGCSADMYIDAEHSSPECLRRVLGQVPGLRVSKQQYGAAVADAAGRT
jgi:hypothetical protein